MLADKFGVPPGTIGEVEAFLRREGIVIEEAAESALLGHLKCGASWEGFAMQEAVRALSVDWEDCYCWATHRVAEIDLLMFEGSRRIGLEFKRTSAPRMTRSMHSALVDLKLDRIFVLFPGDTRFRLHEREMQLD